MSLPTVVIGGGLFGCWAALVLASRGDQEVVLLEQDANLMCRASFVNQARVHTGAHYPRSLLTALSAASSHQRFRETFPEAIRDFKHVYAIANHGSKGDAFSFANYLERIGVESEPVDTDIWFHEGTVEAAWHVPEPTFDADSLRSSMIRKLVAAENLQIRTGCQVAQVGVVKRGIAIADSHGETLLAADVVFATYAGINPLREQLGLAPLPLKYELAEIVLGKAGPAIANHGFTVMDGPFWSMMPFGHSEFSSLTSVGLTPRASNSVEPSFDCQDLRPDCRPSALKDCLICPARPAGLPVHHQQQLAKFLKASDQFTYDHSLMTIKTVLHTAEVDDARPALVLHETDVPVTTVFSGKVTSIFEVESALR